MVETWSLLLCYEELVEQMHVLNFCVSHGSATRFLRVVRSIILIL